MTTEITDNTTETPAPLTLDAEAIALFRGQFEGHKTRAEERVAYSRENLQRVEADLAAVSEVVSRDDAGLLGYISADPAMCKLYGVLQAMGGVENLRRILSPTKMGLGGYGHMLIELTWESWARVRHGNDAVFINSMSIGVDRQGTIVVNDYVRNSFKEIPDVIRHIEEIFGVSFTEGTPRPKEIVETEVVLPPELARFEGAIKAYLNSMSADTHVRVRTKNPRVKKPAPVPPVTEGSAPEEPKAE